MSDDIGQIVNKTRENAKIGQGKPGPGRPKGATNKTTALLKDAILQAAEKAGDKEGLVGYLTVQARENPGPFLSLLGKVLPMQVTGDASSPLVVEIVRFADRNDTR
jgi:hypothetical protein